MSTNGHVSKLFIPDGETRKAYVKAMQFEHPAVRFTYRRARADLLPSLTKVFNERNGGEIREMAGVLAGQLIGLCTVDDAGNNVAVPEEITADNLMLISPFLFRRIQTIVLGYSSSDPDPSDGTVQPTLGADLKNLPAG